MCKACRWLESNARQPVTYLPASSSSLRCPLPFPLPALPPQSPLRKLLPHTLAYLYSIPICKYVSNIQCTHTYIYKCTVYVCICNQPSYRDEAVKVNDPNTKYSDEVCRNTHRTPHVPCTAHANGKCRKVMTSLNSSCIKLRTRTFTHANTLMETFVHG